MVRVGGMFTLTGTIEVRDKDGNLKDTVDVDFGEITEDHAEAIAEAQIEGEI
jgi:hypothetical protein